MCKRRYINIKISEECGHEIRNEFHWSQKSRGTQAIIIATQDRTSYVAVTYERSVSTAESDAIPRLVYTAIVRLHDHKECQR